MAWLLATFQMSFPTASPLPKLTSLFIVNMPSIGLPQGICTSPLPRMCFTHSWRASWISCLFVPLFIASPTSLKASSTSTGFWFFFFFCVVCCSPLAFISVPSWELAKGRKAKRQEMRMEKMMEGRKAGRQEGKEGKWSKWVEICPEVVQGTTKQIPGK